MTEEIMVDLLSTDKQLLTVYHIEAPNTAEICAKRTLADLEKSKAQVHLITENDKVIGYYGIERGLATDFLTGFFIKPENRTKDTIEKFWKEVEQHFNRDFYVGVYKKNTRAIKFLNKKTTNKHEIKDAVFFKVQRS